MCQCNLRPEDNYFLITDCHVRLDIPAFNLSAITETYYVEEATIFSLELKFLQIVIINFF